MKRAGIVRAWTQGLLGALDQEAVATERVLGGTHLSLQVRDSLLLSPIYTIYSSYLHCYACLLSKNVDIWICFQDNPTGFEQG